MISTEPKPYQNLSKEEALKICDGLFKSSVESAISTLRNGYLIAKKMNNLFLAELIQKDIDSYVAIWAEREVKKIELKNTESAG